MSLLEMDVNTALSITDTLIFEKTGKHLTTLQSAVFRGAWLGHKYEEVAEVCNCSDAYAKIVGATLWELLSAVLNEKVGKKTFRAALERYNHLKAEAEFSEASVREREIDLASLPIKGSSSLSTSDNFTRASLAEQSLASSSRDFPQPEGPVPLNSEFYVERSPIETDCYRAIAQPGALIRIKAPCQMGKTSLLVRILHQAQQQSYETIVLNLQLVDRKTLEDPDRFLQWFCAIVTRYLRLPLLLHDYWDDVFGSKISCHDYFSTYLLPQLQQPLVLAFDTVDAIFEYPETASSFFTLLRAWHEASKTSELWQKLRLVLVQSTEANLSLSIHQSPFNVGLSVELPEFNPEQLAILAQRYGLFWKKAQVNQLMDMIGGHPYLVQVALWHLAQNQVPLDELLHQAPTETGAYRDHLRRQLLLLEQRPQLLTALKTMLTATEPVHMGFEDVFLLRSIGLVRLQNSKVTLRCNLYRQYFEQCWASWV